MNNGHDRKRRLIIVSNRLPFTIRQEGNELKFEESAGGLASGLNSYVETLRGSKSQFSDYIWVGWPGSTVGDNLRETVRTRIYQEFHSYPVFLSEQDVENFYQGFCNKTIWPLFHYFTGYVKHDNEYWQQYKKVNQAFCDSLAELVQPDDVIWIHDYHLMLLPGLVRERLPDVPVGFFLHIPFPTFEIYRLLPRKCRAEILEGLLGADLIGFHTYDYMQDFLRCVLRILGYEHNMGQIVLHDRIVKAGTFPMGIDYKKFHLAATGSPEVQREKDELLKSLRESRVILSVDRLDYTKGIIHRLEGFETLLDTAPEWRGAVTLLVVVVPSRIGVQDYEHMKRQIEELVGKINGKFGSVHWTPIIYQFRALSFFPLVAMYSISHVALVTPLRDGMNLIAKEYIASRPDQTGVLVLSEMAGAAKELGEAVILNPNNREEISESLREALEMPREEQIRRNPIMQHRLRRYTVVRWASDFTTELLSIQNSQTKLLSKLITPKVREQIVQAYRAGTRRLLLLDYDGTLTPFAKRPGLAKPGAELLKLLARIADDAQNEIVLISGRSRADLQNWFAALPIALVAEHGVWIKEKNGDWRMLKPLHNDWKLKLLPILENYADRVPGSLVEEKEYSLVWHYRSADPELGTLAARELMDDLLTFTANIDVQALLGHKIVEVRSAGVNKGIAAMHWLSQHSFEFILSLGDDWTDEDLFMALPQYAFTIKVGIGRTHAQFHLRDPKEVLQLIGLLANQANVVA